MSILGSSPLGLTGNASGGYSIGTYVPMTVDGVTGYKSLFQNTIFEPYSGNNSPISGREIGDAVRENIHTEDIYDTDVVSLIDYTAKYPAMVLLPVDFAYCKDIGVFPNNRLIVARRFASPVGDDLTRISASDNVHPLSTLVSWIPDGEDFIKIEYGEKWTDVTEASFKGVLNDIGGNLTTTGIGNIASSGMNIIPLPGVMEGLQYQVMKKMGISAGQIPMGNPNLIREAKMRQIIDDGKGGSGLVGKFKVKMVVEYEQKYIAGVDPTLAYYDIIANALAFGTSDAYFQFNGKFNEGTNNFINDLQKGNVRGVIEALKSFVTGVVQGIRAVAGEYINNFTKAYRSITGPSNDENMSIQEKAEAKLSATKTAIWSSVGKITEDTVGAMIGKYKIRIIGIIHAMTGSNSTPWHVTIGNPKKPIFSSGDMLTTEVTLSLGPILSFNDLPSSIKIEFTLESARNLGAQEIFNKFNNGSGRSYKRLNISIHETSKYIMTKDDNGNEGIKEVAVDNIEYFPRINNYPDVQTNSQVSDDKAIDADLYTQNSDVINPNISGDSVEPQQVEPQQEVSREDIEGGDFYFRYKVRTRTNTDTMTGTAPTEQEARDLIALFAEGDIIMHQEIIKITIPKNNGTN